MLSKMLRNLIIILLFLMPPLIVPLYLYVRWKDKSPKQNERSIVFEGWSFLFYLVIGTFMTIVLFALLRGLIEDYLTWFLLRDKGETITLPLRTVHEFHGRSGARYEAIYEYNDRVLHEKISLDQYQNLKGKHTVSVRVYGNRSKIVGWQPQHLGLFIINWMGSFCVYMALRAIWDAYIQLESVAYQTLTEPPVKRAPTRFGLTKRRILLTYARWRNWKTPPPLIKLPSIDKSRHRHKKEIPALTEKNKRDKVKHKGDKMP